MRRAVLVLASLLVALPMGVTRSDAVAGGRTVMIAIDASGSMAGSRLAAAKEAAESFVDALPSDVAVGVVAFADDASVRLEPTQDRAAVSTAISAIAARGDTAMRDGIIAALPLAGRVVVLSDGEDTASRATAGELATAMEAADVPVDIVALAPTTRHAGWLRAIAGRSGGSYTSSAQASGLAAAFAGVAAVISAAPVPESPPASAFATLMPAKEPASTGLAAPDGDVAPWVPWTLGTLVAASVILLAVGLGGLVRDRARRTSVTRAIDAYASGIAPAPQSDHETRRASVLGRRLREHRALNGLAERMDLAGLTWSPLAWVSACTAAIIAVAVLVAFATGSPVLGLIVVVALALACRQWLHARAASARRSFDAELPDLLMLLASGMRSGLSFGQALEACAQDGSGEVGRQLRRTVAEARLGTPVEEALMRTADRMSSDDLRWTVQALAMQRQVGGNLSSILETAAGSVRDRADLRREIRTLSAEGRLSAWILIALPVLLFLFLVVTRRDYVDFFWTEALGIVALLVFVVIGAIGALWIRAVVRIEA